MPLNQRQMLFWQLHLRTGIELSKFQISIFKFFSKFSPMPEKLDGSIKLSAPQDGWITEPPHH